MLSPCFLPASATCHALSSCCMILCISVFDKCVLCPISTVQMLALHRYNTQKKKIKMKVYTSFTSTCSKLKEQKWLLSELEVTSLSALGRGKSWQLNRNYFSLVVFYIKDCLELICLHEKYTLYSLLCSLCIFVPSKITLPYSFKSCYKSQIQWLQDKM